MKRPLSAAGKSSFGNGSNMLQGYVCDKLGKPVPGALVELKDESFQTVLSAVTDGEGRYCLEAEKGVYPFVTAVKDYGVENLEYWCQNLDLRQDLRLDIRFDKLEIYGLHVFCVRGGMNPLMVYFRPMSLTKFLAGEGDIAPDIKTIEAKLDGRQARILMRNPVKELAGDREMTAYLLQLEAESRNWGKLELSLWDTEGNFGMAGIFNG